MIVVCQKEYKRNLYFNFFPRGVRSWLSASVTLVVFAGRYSMAIDKCDKNTPSEMLCYGSVAAQGSKGDLVNILS